ncbi:MAG: DUF1289 domain-containing protein [Vibrio sp.]
MASSEHIPSPCCRHCCLNDDDVCLGCWRTLSEILRWRSADDSERSKILTLYQQRSRQKGQYDHHE